MSVPADMTERHARALSRLSELGLALAEDLQARALAAESIAEASDLALAFHRISRSVRQTLALEARLERDRHRQDVEDHDRAARQADAPRAVRKAQVRAAVERLVWTEDEDETDRLLDDLDLLLDEAALSPAFLEDPVETQIARICAGLGLTADAAGHASGPPGPGHPPPGSTAAQGFP